MKKGIYITNTESRTGSSFVSLGILKLLLSQTSKVGFFRPIISHAPLGQKDNHIDIMLSHFNLDMEYEDAYGFHVSEIVQYKNSGKTDKIIDTIIEKYKQLEKKFDIVLVEGSDLMGKGVSFEFNLNVEIAKNLSIPTFLVSSAEDKNVEDAVANLELAVKTFAEKDVSIQAVFMNKVKDNKLNAMKTALEKAIPKGTTISVIPEIKKLGNPTIREIYNAIGGKILLGESLLDNQVERYEIGAMQLRNFLDRIVEGSLVITPGDRSDIILGSIQVNASANYPNLSGVLLTGGIAPEKNVLKLVKGQAKVLPIIAVKEVTYEAANKIGNIIPKLSLNDTKKIDLSISTFDKYVNTESLIENFVRFESDVLTPRMFQYNLVTKAKTVKKHIVLPEGTDPRILEAAVNLVEQNIVEITLLGNKEDILAKAQKLGIKIKDNIKIVNPIKSKHYEEYWKTYYHLRKHKNINEDMARDTMLDVSYFGTMMVYLGHADGMVSGAAHTTAHTIVPALQFIKTRPGVNTVSSVFFMCLDDHVSVLGDCALNVNPTADQLAEIAISSAESAKAFGIEPKVALLSYSSGTSGSGKEVEKVKAATEIATTLRPDIKIEGPIQYDAAVDYNIGKSKMPNSEVAGKASVLVFPDLNTGNNTYKAVQRETGALAIGPMLQGLNKPVNDLSRGCTVDDIFNTVVITAIQAQDKI